MFKSGRVKKITEDENRLRVVYNDGTEHMIRPSKRMPPWFSSYLTWVSSLTDLSPDKMKIEIKPPSAWLGIIHCLGYILPFLILGGVFFFIFRQAQGSNNAAMSFGKSRARMFTGDHPTVTFDDVAGVDEVQGRTERSGRILARAAEIHPARRAHSQRRSAGWPSRNR